MKKLLALVLAFAMVLGCTAMAFAASPAVDDYDDYDDYQSPVTSSPSTGMLTSPNPGVVTAPNPGATAPSEPAPVEPAPADPEVPVAVDSTGVEVEVEVEELTEGEVAVAIQDAVEELVAAPAEDKSVVDFIKAIAAIAVPVTAPAEPAPTEPVEGQAPAEGTTPEEPVIVPAPVITDVEKFVEETMEAVKEVMKAEIEAILQTTIEQADEKKVEEAVVAALETFEPAKVVDIVCDAAAEDNPVDVSFPVAGVRLTSKVIGLHQAATGWEVVPAKVVGIGQVAVTLTSCSPVVVLVADDGDPFGDFVDLNPLEWYHDGLSFMLKNGYMGGVGNNKFDPAGTVTRAMMATSLYKIAGEKVAATHGFTDVAEGAWYADAVAWAYANKIVGGTSETAFSPDALLTREQAVTFMYNYAKAMGKDVSKTTDISMATDIAQVSSWARTAMEWAVEAGIVHGTTADALTLGAQNTMDRVSLAVLLANFIQL